MEKGKSFEEVLPEIKKGRKARRSGWNGKNMFIFRQPGYPEGVPANGNTACALGIPEGDIVRVRPYLMLQDAQGMLVPWLASQTDILAEDWELC